MGNGHGCFKISGFLPIFENDGFLVSKIYEMDVGTILENTYIVSFGLLFNDRGPDDCTHTAYDYILKPWSFQ